MKQNKFLNVLVVVILVIIISITGYFLFIKKTPQVSPAPIQPETSIKYTNAQYGFDLSLPISWSGYSIVTTGWEGNMIDNKTNQSVSGPEFLVRHPLWTSENPRQDIPIMIFTLSQWDLVQQERLSLGAAPIPPSELGRNINYVFALPARYNFAFPTGFEEVEQIIASNPLHTF